ncbi:ABC transporter permease [Herbiconiux sp. KACC 21604]|uniref:ABC transporter permease n=1 Tax=unclassified Herbiconiux TaxID=2618217 RepID=UPI001490FE0B|nr:ABC transporter permease [Herbiconiux sp. SALV-R1]QJU52572.1 ABC transporter permease [Herbiconiux sp. SALV-R1]WPO87454.1 ABC transporter permease [Herbiconiux sp. KACC 21604]
MTNTATAATQLADDGDSPVTTSPPRRRGAWSKNYRWVITAAVGLFVLLVWQLVAVLFDLPTYILPTPVDAAESLWTNRDELWTATLVTTGEVLAGFSIAVLVSIPVAMLLVSFRWFETIVYPFIVLLQTVPKIALAPLFVVWFGFGILPKVLVTFLICFFPILLDTMTGLRSSNPDMASLVRSMGGGTWSIFRKVRLPAALPHVFAGVKVAITLAVVGAVVGEFVGATQGLGYLLLRANANLDTPLLFAAIAILTVLGLVLYYAVSLVERLVIPWHVSQRSEGTVTTGPAV